MIRRVLATLTRPLLRVLLRLAPVDDPWERLDARVGLQYYGSGARHDFDWYFDGPTAVIVHNLDDVTDWLLGCTYCRDPDLFREPDFWQHPRTFEELRKGDCEDYALWAWRKLVELGYDADLVVGRCLPQSPGGSRHAWVVFRRDGTEYLLDGVVRTKEHIVRPLSEARDEYRPEFGVGRDRKRFAFSGYLLTLRERELGGNTGESAWRTA
jgi:hypothetical protein